MALLHSMQVHGEIYELIIFAAIVCSWRSKHSCTSAW